MQGTAEGLELSGFAATEFPEDEVAPDELSVEDSGEWTAFESLFSLAGEEDSYAALQALRMDDDRLADEHGSISAMSDPTPQSARPARRTLQWLKRNVSSFRVTVSLQRPGSRQRTAFRNDRDSS